MTTEREIVVGSTWAHGNGEVTVKDHRNGGVFLDDGNVFGTETFRELFRHVRDPEPEIKLAKPVIGNWYKTKRGDRFKVIRSEDDGATWVIAWEPKFIRDACRSKVFDYEPCEPPAREKAIAELVEECRSSWVANVREKVAAYDAAMEGDGK